jgi:acyl carrier protein
MSVRAQVIATITEVAKQQGKKLSQISDELPLLESGLDSLCLAIIVARLEDRLYVDPFSSEEAVEIPTTIGDFIRLYEHAAR